jgi:hypothetical protein
MAGHLNRDSNVKETEHVILQERAVGYNIWANMVYLLKEGSISVTDILFSFLFFSFFGYDICILYSWKVFILTGTGIFMQN